MGLDMNVKCKAYHGTDVHCKKRIIDEQHFISSSRDNEWAGTGVYFFIDSNENIAQVHEYNWARNYKNIPIYNVRILFAEIEYNKDEIFDLSDEQDLEVFNAYRRSCFEKAVKIAEKKEKILSDRYSNASKFDCFVINEICKKSNYKMVKKQVYISKLEETYEGVNIPRSFVPNCTIAAVRDQSIIRKIGEIDGQKTCGVTEITH